MWPRSWRPHSICHSTPKFDTEVYLESVLLTQIILAQKGLFKAFFFFQPIGPHFSLLPSKSPCRDHKSWNPAHKTYIWTSYCFQNTVRKKILFHFCKGKRSQIMNPLSTTQVNCFKNSFVCISNDFHCKASSAFLKVSCMFWHYKR